MIRQCGQSDFDAMYVTINDAAQAYRNVIPADRWNEPYMSREYLHMRSMTASHPGDTKRTAN